MLNISSPFGSLPNYVEVAVGGHNPQGHSLSEAIDGVIIKVSYRLWRYFLRDLVGSNLGAIVQETINQSSQFNPLLAC